MTDQRSRPSPPSRRRAARRTTGTGTSPLFAALDLGTNNCRLLIAEAQGAGFRVVDGYSQIVRLGEGLAAAGRLSDAAMTRALGALRVCAEKIAAWPIAAARCIATQACRGSANGGDFLDRVKRETGLTFNVITPREEAELAVIGCSSLIDPRARAALVVDIGGGSTEISWVAGGRERGAVIDWASLPFGVVTLADRCGDRIDEPEGYAEAVDEIRAALADFDRPEIHAAFAQGGVHYLGTSGTVTSLAGVWLGLPHYRRSKVDGLWMSVADTRSTADALRAMPRAQRAMNPCIGPDRADLVVPGAAILEAIFTTWAGDRIRVADRGLREGVLSRLIAESVSETHGGR